MKEGSLCHQRKEVVDITEDRTEQICACDPVRSIRPKGGL